MHHTLDLPGGNRTTDQAIIEVCREEHRVVVTKDADFVNSFLLLHEPRRLLLISTGNLSNAALEALLVPNIPAIVSAFEGCDFVELTHTSLKLHP